MISQAIRGLEVPTVGIVEKDDNMLCQNSMLNNEVTERTCNVL